MVRLIPLQSFELIEIHLRKCVQKGLKRSSYSIYMNMNKRDFKPLKEKTLISSINMNKRDLKTLKKRH